MTAALEGGEWSAAFPGRTLPPGKSRYPFYRRRGGPPGPVWTGGKSRPHRDSIRTVQPVVSRYTDWATRPTDVRSNSAVFTNNQWLHHAVCPTDRQIVRSSFISGGNLSYEFRVMLTTNMDLGLFFFNLSFLRLIRKQWLSTGQRYLLTASLGSLWYANNLTLPREALSLIFTRYLINLYCLPRTSRTTQFWQELLGTREAEMCHWCSYRSLGSRLLGF